MRIDLPPEDMDAPFAHVAEHYAPEIVARAGDYGSAPYKFSKLTLREVEAARFRTAQINGCNTCIQFRGARDFPTMFENYGWNLESSVHGRGAPPDAAFYENVENWRDWPGYSERERLAIRYAEGLGQDPHGIAQDEDFWSRAKAVFSDDEIVDLSYSIGAWMATGRVLHALGLDTVCFADMARRTEAA
jgi:alkylhydroperoxidase family enzyme